MTRALIDELRPVSGCRNWEVASVSAECPHCHERNEIDPHELIEEEIWSMIPWEHECEACGKYFWIEVDDDDR